MDYVLAVFVVRMLINALVSGKNLKAAENKMILVLGGHVHLSCKDVTFSCPYTFGHVVQVIKQNINTGTDERS